MGLHWCGRAYVATSLLLGLSLSSIANAHEHRSLSAQTLAEPSTSAESQAKQVTALRITAENAATLIKKGPDAIGGIGDWFISNGTLCAIISDVNHEHEFSTKGGSLVDLGFCGREDDHYTVAEDLVDAKRERPLDAVSISATVEQNEARIIVKSSTVGATQDATYALSIDAPTQLSVSKTLSRTDEKGYDFSVYSSLHFNYHSLEPFVFASRDLSQTNGFKNEDFVSRGLSALSVASRNADTIITISPPTATAPISYGWQLKSARRVDSETSYEVPRFVLADDESNAFLVLSDTFYIGSGDKIGWLQIPQIPLLSLPNGTTLEIEEVIYVGKNGDVASITDQILGNTQRVFGRVNDPEMALHIDQKDGTPLTHVRPKADGTFEFRVPSGQYQLRQVASAKRVATEYFDVGDRERKLKPKTLSKAASLELPKGEAMRLVFVGLEGTPSPDFTDTYTASSIIEDDGPHYKKAVSQIFLAGLKGDASKVTLAPGRYRIYATRGPEYSLETTEVILEPGTETRLNIATPEHRLATPGYIASDLHVHSGSGFDNTFSDTERVRTFVAEHGEVMVSSEHDLPVDFAPLITTMGASQKIVSIAAAEITSLIATSSNPHTGGHSNFFPFTPEPYAYRRGMIEHEDKRLRDIIHAVRQKHPDVVVQLNHPRLNLALSDDIPDDFRTLINNAEYLEHMGPAGYPYNPSKTLDSSPNNSLIEKDPDTGLRDLDFDLIEVINPGGEYHHARIQAVRKDWLSFLKQGEKIVGTANSDSHTSAAQVGLPRTMVAMSDDRVTEFDQAAFLRALKAGNAYGSTGPMINISLSDKQMGETFQGQQGLLKLGISSVDWISVDTAKIQVNGETIAEYQLSGQQSTHNLVVPMSFEKDSFVTIEVSGPASADYSVIYPELTPYAFSNPIYVDFDADGKWQAPGL